MCGVSLTCQMMRERRPRDLLTIRARSVRIIIAENQQAIWDAPPPTRDMSISHTSHLFIKTLHIYTLSGGWALFASEQSAIE